MIELVTDLIETISLKCTLSAQVAQIDHFGARSTHPASGTVRQHAAHSNAPRGAAPLFASVR
ncbi:hypothetical protein [Paraburkholderia dilworthii]|uniref:hypothetical protein n=1 Tax=Paraburkholderia dilworthii TaxID=948106 RepID=UPI001267FECA|nr:hypothetical protein [Paraburkholderia dilworthii]